jgi:hypothetical protein
MGQPLSVRSIPSLPNRLWPYFHTSYDAAVSALLGEGWEPFGIAADGALWFRKADISATGWLSADGTSADHLQDGIPAVEPVEALAGFAPA